MTRPRFRTALAVSLVAALTLLTGCLNFDVKQLASDSMGGRNNNTAGGASARSSGRTEHRKMIEPKRRG